MSVSNAKVAAHKGNVPNMTQRVVHDRAPSGRAGHQVDN
jgi:hypothetical protein